MNAEVNSGNRKAVLASNYRTVEFRILSLTSFLRIFRVSSFKRFSCLCLAGLMFAETSSSAYRNLASLADPLLARHATFSSRVELLEKTRLERKVAP